VIVEQYSACTEELRKIAVQFNMPGLKLFKTKLRAQTVSGLKPGTAPKPAQLPKKTMNMAMSPEISVGEAGRTGESIQPPPVRT
jgi:hypothetical protein